MSAARAQERACLVPIVSFVCWVRCVFVCCVELCATGSHTLTHTREHTTRTHESHANAHPPTHTLSHARENTRRGSRHAGTARRCCKAAEPTVNSVRHVWPLIYLICSKTLRRWLCHNSWPTRGQSGETETRCRFSGNTRRRNTDTWYCAHGR